MKVHSRKRIADTKVLFIWDGSRDSFDEANRIIEELGPAAIYAAHAMPHESIYHYGHICNESRSNWLEADLRNQFREMAKPFRSFGNVNLTLLFGDRVNEIVRFANQLKIDKILMPRFKQSCFSTWIHGDLNARLVDKFNGCVEILGETTVSIQLMDPDLSISDAHINE